MIITLMIHCGIEFLLSSIPITANVLKCKLRLKTKFKCMCIAMCSLVINLFSRDYIENKSRLIKVSAMF